MRHFEFYHLSHMVEHEIKNDSDYIILNEHGKHYLIAEPFHNYDNNSPITVCEGTYDECKKKLDSIVDEL